MKKILTLLAAALLIAPSLEGATKLQIRRFNASADANGYIGAKGEPFFDAEGQTFRMGDGVTAGGILVNAGYAQPSSLTIASGVVAYSSPYARIDTQGATATDDLDTITFSGQDGTFMFIQAENGARDVVIKDGTGNIQLFGDTDVTLDGTDDLVLLMYNGDTSTWNGGLIGGGTGGGGGGSQTPWASNIDGANKNLTGVATLNAADIKATNTLNLVAATASRVAVFDASKNLTSGAATGTEVGYMAGVTGPIQAQLDLKAPSASPTLTTPTLTGGTTVTGGLTSAGTGSNSTIIGSGATSTGIDGIAIGSAATANGPQAGIALGKSSSAPYSGSVAIGRYAVTGADDEIVLGNTTNVIVMGGQVRANADIVSTSNNDINLIPDGTGKVGIGTASPTVFVQATKSSVGAAVEMRVGNDDNTSGLSHGQVKIQNGGSSGGDPQLLLTLNGEREWSVGADNSDGNKFKVGPSPAVGTSTILTLDPTGSGITNNASGNGFNVNGTDTDIFGPVTMDTSLDVAGRVEANALRQTQVDLNGGTTLTNGIAYYDSRDLSSNPTLTFSGTPAQGDVIRLFLKVTTGGTLNFPTSEVYGSDGTTTTSKLLWPGEFELVWKYKGDGAGGSEWIAYLPGPRNNETTSDPSNSTDDITLGYSVGSLWINTSNDTEWRCVDNTDGAAVWINQAANQTSLALSDGNGVAVEGTPDAIADSSFQAFKLLSGMTLGYTASKFDLVYFDVNGKLSEADADLSEAAGKAIGFVTAAGVSNDTVDVLVSGIIRDDTLFNFTTNGITLYVDTVAGAATNIPPSASGAVVKAIGWTIDADNIYVDVTPHWSIAP